MNKQPIIISWFVWHFYEMVGVLFSAWKNYISFGLDFFSIPTLLRTLFSPWRMYEMRYPGRFDLGAIFGSFIYNLFSRVMGAVCRLGLIAIAIGFEMVILVLGAVVILVWICLPLVVIGLVVLAVK